MMNARTTIVALAICACGSYALKLNQMPFDPAQIATMAPALNEWFRSNQGLIQESVNGSIEELDSVVDRVWNGSVDAKIELFRSAKAGSLPDFAAELTATLSNELAQFRALHSPALIRQVRAQMHPNHGTYAGPIGDNLRAGMNVFFGFDFCMDNATHQAQALAGINGISSQEAATRLSNINATLQDCLVNIHSARHSLEEFAQTLPDVLPSVESHMPGLELAPDIKASMENATWTVQDSLSEFADEVVSAAEILVLSVDEASRIILG
jgi:hypothetical protein